MNERAVGWAGLVFFGLVYWVLVWAVLRIGRVARDGTPTGKQPPLVTWSRSFHRRFRVTRWWAAGITVLLLGPRHCGTFMADAGLLVLPGGPGIPRVSPAGAIVEFVANMSLAVLLNMLFFGTVFAGVVACVDVLRYAKGGR